MIHKCQNIGGNLKYVLFVINDKSQDSTAKLLSYDGLLHYKFIVQFAGERICKNYGHVDFTASNSITVPLTPKNIEHKQEVIPCQSNAIIGVGLLF